MGLEERKEEYKEKTNCKWKRYKTRGIKRANIKLKDNKDRKKEKIKPRK
jgi:hypothetical protein